MDFEKKIALEMLNLRKLNDQLKLDILKAKAKEKTTGIADNDLQDLSDRIVRNRWILNKILYSFKKLERGSI